MSERIEIASNGDRLVMAKHEGHLLIQVTEYCEYPRFIDLTPEQVKQIFAWLLGGFP